MPKLKSSSFMINTKILLMIGKKILHCKQINKIDNDVNVLPDL
mgnify:CR=1 FL=1